jgi:O-antigen/teichoic acid export membrane protein/O-antigen ligase
MKVLGGGEGSPTSVASSPDDAAGPKRGHFHRLLGRRHVLLTTAPGSRRAAVTLLDQVFSSVSNFAVGVAVARGAGAAGLGGFTFAYAGWLVLSALHRSLITDPMAIEGDIRNSKTNDGVKKGFAAEVLLGLSAAVCFVALGAVLLFAGQHTFGFSMVLLAPWLPFLVVQDYWRWVGFMSRRPGRALANDTVYNFVQALAFAAVFAFQKQSEATLIASWGLAAVAGAFYGLWQNRVWPSLKGGLTLLRVRWSVSKWIAGSALTAWGSSQTYILVAGAILGPAGLGGLKAAQALVSGPSGVLVQAGGSVGLPEATKSYQEKGWRGLTRVTRVVTAVGFLSFVAGAVMVVLFGRFLLSRIYGLQFAQYDTTAILFGIAYIFVGFNLAPILVLKATRKTRPLLYVQIVSLIVSLCTMVGFCVVWGVTGAAVAVVITYGVTAATYQLYARRTRRSSLLEESTGNGTLRLDQLETVAAGSGPQDLTARVGTFDGPELPGLASGKPTLASDRQKTLDEVEPVTPSDILQGVDATSAFDDKPIVFVGTQQRPWGTAAVPAAACVQPLQTAVQRQANPRRQKTPEEKRLHRVRIIWALLFFNVLSFTLQPIVLPIPHTLGQVMTQGALVLALLLALTVNPRLRVRPNLFLTLYSVLAITTLMMSVRFVSLGTVYRASRLVEFVAVLWLLTPWWGRRDLLLLRVQVRVLVWILASVMLGLLLAPHKAYVLNAGERRLQGAIWPMPATQVGHYVAELTGLVILLWLCKIWSHRRALPILAVSIAGLLLSHTRTALLGMVIGLVIAGLSLLTGSRRVRRVFAAVLLIMVTLVLPLSPVLSSWVVRGESATEFSDLSGRTEVWPQVLSEPRPETNKIFGSGMGNGSVVGALNPAYDGLSIDGGWIATYQSQGIVGIVLEGAMFIVLLLTALLRPPSPARAMALFLIVYCLVASFAETGLGDASTYLLDLALAASLLSLPLGSRAANWKPSLRVTA